MARPEGNRASWLVDAPKPPLSLSFPSNGVANVDNNHMPLVHYTGQFTARKVMLFHRDIVPFCANARENNPRRGIARQKFSVYVPKRNTVLVLHSNSHLIDEVKRSELTSKF
jgi:hypothetical protein